MTQLLPSFPPFAWSDRNGTMAGWHSNSSQFSSTGCMGQKNMRILHFMAYSADYIDAEGMDGRILTIIMIISHDTSSALCRKVLTRKGIHCPSPHNFRSLQKCAFAVGAALNQPNTAPTGRHSVVHPSLHICRPHARHTTGRLITRRPLLWQ